MSNPDPKFLLIVKVPRGIVIIDTPRSQAQGAQVRRSVAVGTPLDALSIHNVGGVQYARLVPQNPLKQEWVRVAEADHSIEYVDVFDLHPDEGLSELIQSLSVLANANTLLATALRELARKP